MPKIGEESYSYGLITKKEIISKIDSTLSSSLISIGVGTVAGAIGGAKFFGAVIPGAILGGGAALSQVLLTGAQKSKLENLYKAMKAGNADAITVKDIYQYRYMNGSGTGWYRVNVDQRNLSYAYPIQYGSTDIAVRYLQVRLKGLGFYRGDVDGSFGPGMKQAVMDFQKSRGISIDGSIGPTTWQYLFYDYPYIQPVYLGSNNIYVGQVQNRLKKMGYYGSSVDNNFGPGTQSAVKAYQSDAGLDADGSVGPATWSSLMY